MAAPPPQSPSQPEATRPRWRRHLRWVFGLVILGTIVALVDPLALWAQLRRADLRWVAGAAGIVMLSIPLRAARLRLLLHPELPRRPSVWEATTVYCYAIFVGVVTPGRVGEFVKIVHVRQWGASNADALATVILDRLFDVGALLATGFAALWLLQPQDVAIPPAAIVAATVVGVVAVLAVLARGRIGAKLAERGGRLAKAWSMVAPALDAAARLRPALVVTTLVLTAGAWALSFAANWMLGVSLGLPLTYPQMCAVSAIGSLVTLIPVSVMGAGTRDAAFVVLLARHGIDGGQAVGLSMMFLALILWTGVASAWTLWTRAGSLNWRTPTE